MTVWWILGSLEIFEIYNTSNSKYDSFKLYCAIENVLVIRYNDEICINMHIQIVQSSHDLQYIGEEMYPWRIVLAS